MKYLFLKSIFIVFVSIIQPTLIFAQTYSSQNSAAIKSYEEAVEELKKRKFEEAFESLQNALKKDPNFAEAHYRMAILYEMYQLREKMFFHYDKAVSNNPNKRSFQKAYPKLVQENMNKGDYEKVKTLCNQYLALQPTDIADIKYIKKSIADCDYAAENMKNALPFNPKPLVGSVNSLGLQYFPVLTADEKTLIFTAIKKTTKGFSDQDMYVSYWKNEAWSAPVSISDNINTVENEGTCAISADGKFLVFTSCNSRSDNIGRCDLYACFKVGNEWGVPVNLGRNVNAIHWDSQPSLSADGKTLYFVSDRPGGSGGKDIWMSRLGDNGEWMPAVNLGTNINTSDDEIAPMMHVNGKNIFFCSDGYPGFGGYDIYSAELGKDGWSKPMNLGYPINTSQDQIGLFITSDGKKGYYSVEKTEGITIVSSILNVFDVPEQIKPTIKSNYVKGVVYDSKTNQKLAADIDLFDVNTDTRETSVTSDAKDGTYLITINEGAEYALKVLKQGYAFKSLSFNYAAEKDSKPLEIDIPLDPIAKGTIFRLNNIFFEFGKYELQEKSKAELDELVKYMIANKSISGEISGHTDNIGSMESNQVLSENRAKSVYDYLINAGIEKERLTFKGYGAEQPSADNNTDAGRALNRRIEFKIL